ncbi:NAD(P)/FAD-dependent oxidoreductase [Campylobacter curvus]|uniref:NAD(P)/FAD-dependent oxidoreductase n=1 Tax=Campylobacter curvus TaxID=200 RepID=UPI0014705BA7|nr:FAD-dependent oxidoreductase [Campylobacter curvus]
MSKVVVIGAGVSGLMSAYELAKNGEDVLVIERGDGDYDMSGILSAFKTPPLAHDGVISGSLKRLFVGTSELSISPSLNENFRSWMTKFSLSINDERIKKSQILFEKFGGESYEIYARLNEKYSQIDFKRNGQFLVFTDENSFKKRLDSIKIGDQTQEILDVEGVKNELGFLNQNIKGVIDLKQNAQIDVQNLADALKRELENLGANIVKDEIASWEFSGSLIAKAIGKENAYEADTFVLASGIDTLLASRLGSKLNLIPSKFYSVDLKFSAEKIPSKPVVLNDLFAKIMPKTDGVKITSGLQIGNIDTLVRMDKINEFLNALKPFGTTCELKEPRYRANFIALTPNDMPLIGRDEVYKNLVFSMGHGWLGLSFAPTSARLVARLISEDKENIDINELLLFSGFYQG